ncbi:MAG: hypothetical protein OER90_08115 [Gemmatimonadota bacterium]|nr:hypothetical protein [Gemmatimonadota bacterium]
MRTPAPPASPTMHVVAACSTVLGPYAAWLYQAGHMDLFRSAYLLNLWVVIVLALAGVAIGAYAVIRGARVIGVGSVVVNAAVVALYGFLALFFGLGGSR